MLASLEEHETRAVQFPGAWYCLHSGLSVDVVLVDSVTDEISEEQLQVYTVVLLRIKCKFPSWTVERISQNGAGRGSTVVHLSSCSNSTTANSSSFEPRPPATINISGDLVLTEDVRHLSVGIGGSERFHCCPVVPVRSALVTSPVKR